MRRALGLATLLGIGAIASHARAEPPTSVEIGLRTGYGKGYGQGLDSKTIKGEVPVWVDLGLRLIPRAFVGVYFQYGAFVLDHRSTTSSSSSTPYDIRSGAQGQFHILPGGDFDPWAGVGLGFEALESTNRRGSALVSLGMNVSLGLDIKLQPNLGLGPFVDLSIGDYLRKNNPYDDAPRSGLHGFLTVGVRIYYDIALGKPTEDGESPKPKPAPHHEPVTDDAAAPSPAPAPKAVDRGTCSLVCLTPEGAPRYADKVAVEAGLAKYLAALRTCAGGGKTSVKIVVSFDAKGHAAVSPRPDCEVPSVSDVSGPPNATWQCTDYCE